MATGLEKVSFHSSLKERQRQRMLNYRTITLISHASKVMLKILQAKLQHFMNREFPAFQAGLKKAEEPEIKLPTSIGSSKKQESSIKTSTSILLTMSNAFDCVDHKLWKILKETGIPDYITYLLRKRDGMEREVGGGLKMGNTCIPVVDSFRYLAKPIQYCKV